MGPALCQAFPGYPPKVPEQTGTRATDLQWHPAPRPSLLFPSVISGSRKEQAASLFFWLPCRSRRPLTTLWCPCHLFGSQRVPYLSRPHLCPHLELCWDRYTGALGYISTATTVRTAGKSPPLPKGVHTHLDTSTNRRVSEQKLGPSGCEGFPKGCWHPSLAPLWSCCLMPGSPHEDTAVELSFQPLMTASLCLVV